MSSAELDAQLRLLNTEGAAIIAERASSIRQQQREAIDTPAIERADVSISDLVSRLIIIPQPFTSPSDPRRSSSFLSSTQLVLDHPSRLSNPPLELECRISRMQVLGDNNCNVHMALVEFSLIVNRKPGVVHVFNWSVMPAYEYAIRLLRSYYKCELAVGIALMMRVHIDGCCANSVQLDPLLRRKTQFDRTIGVLAIEMTRYNNIKKVQDALKRQETEKQ